MFEKTTTKKKPPEKKLLGEKKIHSTIFYVLHNKDFKKMLYCDLFFFLNANEAFPLLQRPNPLPLPSQSLYPYHPQKPNPNTPVSYWHSWIKP